VMCRNFVSGQCDQRLLLLKNVISVSFLTICMYKFCFRTPEYNAQHRPDMRSTHRPRIRLGKSGTARIWVPNQTRRCSIYPQIPLIYWPNSVGEQKTSCIESICSVCAQRPEHVRRRSCEQKLIRLVSAQAFDSFARDAAQHVVSNYVRDGECKAIVYFMLPKQAAKQGEQTQRELTSIGIQKGFEK
jgi:hypothetical protein